MADKPVDPLGPYFPVAVDAAVWAEEVERLAAASEARRAAQSARRRLAAHGIATGLLARCEANALDGTRLEGCLKARVPLGRSASSEAPFGFVFEPVLEAARGLTLHVLAYGERHPEVGRSVYQRAHKRLHGRYPEEEPDRAPDRPA